MLSIIIPTLWQPPVFPYFINLLAQSSAVGEIIVLDNAIEKKYPEKNDKFFKNAKIKIIPLPTNVGVNVAWNIGADIAEESNLAILNDDIIFDISILKKTDFILSNDTSVGLICGPSYKDSPEYSMFSNVLFEKVSEQIYMGAGTMMFLKKENYKKIPKELKVFFGDNFLFDILEAKKLQHYKLVNLPYFTIGSETIDALDEKSAINKFSLYETEGDLYCKDIAPRMIKYS